jgi:signal peptidase I
MASCSLRPALSSLLLTFPVAVWTIDNLYGLYRVSGSSMEPTFQSGDIVLVRKSDTPLAGPDPHDPDLKAVRLHEARLGMGGDWISRPPLVKQGDVVVFASPANPQDANIKRIIAVGGQQLQPPDRFRRIETIPKYSVWVEGDNRSNSQDSRHYGSVSKKLLVGKAECVVWPPSRWAKVETGTIPQGRAWWY